jgi:REP element-mobilizing transposase RayT
MSLIQKDFQERLYNYIIAIIQNYGHKVLSIGGTKDHIHIFFDYKLTQPIPELVQIIKRDSSRWLNENIFLKGKFSWQEGYGAFSYSQTQINRVIEYIKDQENHHNKQSFEEEYITLLEGFNVKYDKRYIFNKVE